MPFAPKSYLSWRWRKVNSRVHDRVLPHAEARAGLYALLALGCAASRARDRSGIAKRISWCLRLAQALPIGSILERRLKELASSLSASQDSSLNTEYHRLFIGPYKLAAPPYASLYLEAEPAIMGRSTLEVLRLYEEAGFVLSPSFRDLPDHIVAELEFMALLCEREQKARQGRDISEVALVIAREATFLKHHLSRWIPRFSSRILAATEMPFYRALALLAQDYVLLDGDYVQAMNGLLARKRLLPEAKRDEA